jgi:hypothetical protein
MVLRRNCFSFCFLLNEQEVEVRDLEVRPDSDETSGILVSSGSGWRQSVSTGTGEALGCPGFPGERFGAGSPTTTAASPRARGIKPVLEGPGSTALLISTRSNHSDLHVTLDRAETGDLDTVRHSMHSFAS